MTLKLNKNLISVLERSDTCHRHVSKGNLIIMISIISFIKSAAAVSDDSSVTPGDKTCPGLAPL